MTNPWGDPADDGADNDSPTIRVGRSAINRLAFRSIRRDLRRSLLIVALLAVPVAVAIVVAAGYRAVWPSAEASRSVFTGTADVDVWFDLPGFAPRSADPADDVRALSHLIEQGRLDEATAEDIVATARTLSLADVSDAVGTAFDNAPMTVLTMSWHQLGDRSVMVQGLDVNDPITDAMVTIDQGRDPRAGEIVLSPPLAELLDASIGEVVSFGPVESAMVVGIGRLRSEHHGLVAIVTPSATTTAQHVQFLVDFPEGQPFDSQRTNVTLQSALAELLDPAVADTVLTSGFVTVNPTADQWSRQFDGVVQPPVLSGFVTALLLCAVALVAAAAFATGARRRITEFGLLATVGASPGHVRRLVLAEAAMIGVVGAIVGVVAGFVAAPMGTGLAQRVAWRTIDGMAASPVDAFGPVLAAIAGSVLAAWIPARTVARVPVLEALAGRVPQRTLRSRVLPLSLALVAAGLAVVAAGAASIRETQAGTQESVVMVIGCLLCLAGAALAASFVAGSIGRKAERFPLGFRLVTRDAARQQFRTAVSVAGLVVVLAAPVMVVVAARSGDATSRTQQQSEARVDEVRVHLLTSGIAADGEQIDQLAKSLSEVVPVTSSGTLQGLVASSDREPTFDDLVGAWVDSGRVESFALAVFGTPDVVATLRLSDEVAALLAGGKAVGIGIGSTEHGERKGRLDSSGSDLGEIEVVPVDVEGSANLSPQVLLPPSLAATLGLVPYEAPFQLVAVTDHPLSKAERDQVRVALARSDVASTMSVTIGDSFEPLAGQVQAIALPVGVFLVLVIGGCLVAVAATESDRDLATMVRVGASPGLRRRFLALQGWYHATLAAVLAVPIGLLLMVALRNATYESQPLAVPWVTMAVVVVVAPVALATVIAVTTRSTPP